MLTISEKGYYIIVDAFNVVEAYKAQPSVDKMADRNIAIEDDSKSSKSERKVRFVEESTTDRDSNSSAGLSVSDTTQTSVTQNNMDTEVIDFSKDENSNETQS